MLVYRRIARVESGRGWRIVASSVTFARSASCFGIIDAVLGRDGQDEVLPLVALFELRALSAWTCAASRDVRGPRLDAERFGERFRLGGLAI